MYVEDGICETVNGCGPDELVLFAAAAIETRTPVIALRVLGVIVAPPDTDRLIMLRNAAVLGDGGGKGTGPPIRGVRPVPGVTQVSPVRGVRPVRKLDGSNASVPSPFGCCGPGSMVRSVWVAREGCHRECGLMKRKRERRCGDAAGWYVSFG